ncbi:hypothetical protein [Campylobacter sp. RM16191]|uniref:hypothetical protein n=1 Tax=Campylobacter sp. RM16191 TaxID=1705728 RepID=UPI00147680C1|nr:hypothetical protein [Campylobacter sp. RM16191]
MQNIKSGYNTKITSGAKNVSGKGKEFLVRFYNDMVGEYVYVSSGTRIIWDDHQDDRTGKIVYKRALINAKNSEKYYVKNKMFRNTSPQGNGDIDHFIELEDGTILATAVAGEGGYYEVSREAYEEERWDERF